MAREWRSLDRVPGTLETIRQEYALTQAEAVDALSRGLAGSDSLQAAYNRTADEEQRRGRGRGAASKGADGADAPVENRDQRAGVNEHAAHGPSRGRSRRTVRPSSFALGRARPC